MAGLGHSGAAGGSAAPRPRQKISDVALRLLADRKALNGFLCARRWEALIQRAAEVADGQEAALKQAVKLWQAPSDERWGANWGEYARRALASTRGRQVRPERAKALKVLIRIGNEAEGWDLWPYLVIPLGYGLLYLLLWGLFLGAGGLLFLIPERDPADPGLLDLLLSILFAIFAVILGLIAGVAWLLRVVLKYLAVPAAVIWLIYILVRAVPRHRRCSEALKTGDIHKVPEKFLFRATDGASMITLSDEPDRWAEPSHKTKCGLCEDIKWKGEKTAEERTLLQAVLFKLRCLKCGAVVCNMHAGWYRPGWGKPCAAGVCPHCNAMIHFDSQKLGKKGHFLEGVALMIADWTDIGKFTSDAWGRINAFADVIEEHTETLRRAAREIQERHGLGRGEAMSREQKREYFQLCAPQIGVEATGEWFNLLTPVFTGPLSSEWILEQIDAFDLEDYARQLVSQPGNDTGVARLGSEPERRPPKQPDASVRVGSGPARLTIQVGEDRHRLAVTVLSGTTGLSPQEAAETAKPGMRIAVVGLDEAQAVAIEEVYRQRGLQISASGVSAAARDAIRRFKTDPLPLGPGTLVLHLGPGAATLAICDPEIDAFAVECALRKLVKLGVETELDSESACGVVSHATRLPYPHAIVLGGTEIAGVQTAAAFLKEKGLAVHVGKLSLKDGIVPPEREFYLIRCIRCRRPVLAQVKAPSKCNGCGGVIALSAPPKYRSLTDSR